MITVIKYPKLTLKDLMTPERQQFFFPKYEHVFNNQLEDYVYKCDLSLGQSRLEGALVYGYPLDYAVEEMLNEKSC